MDFQELTSRVRDAMEREFQKELSTPRRWRSKTLQAYGSKTEEKFNQLLLNAIRHGDHNTLRHALARESRIRPHQADLLSHSEFSTWYVRGLARVMIADRLSHCEVYRADAATEENPECSRYEGQLVPVKAVYEGHRSRYWPRKNVAAFSIPYSPWCHHLIRRPQSQGSANVQ